MEIRENCADIRPQLGVYLTGAIAPADRAVVVWHLTSCGRCREELTSLAGLPGLLHRSPGPAMAEPSTEPLPASPPTQEVPAASSEPDEGGALLSRVLRRIAVRRRRNRWLLTTAAVLLAVGTAAGWTMRLSEPAMPGQVTSGTVLETKIVGDVTVLTDTEGLTLYWYTPDTPTTSNCTGHCTTQWPPVTGPGIAGDDVTGTLGSITRPDGTMQATYNGHPLYTASADTAPGQAKGNDVRDSGGVWHEVVVSGKAGKPGQALPSSGPSYGS